ncbi:MAG: leucine-rich repeat domain-containing protein, partial [Clostridia bacterium]|nr:leucine-rich repeat domain-containing protein [Clostridia bacterium]
NGKDGAKGVGVKNISKTANGELIVELTDLTQFNLGKINGENGTDGIDGVGVIKAELNANGEVVFTYSDGRQQNIGIIPDCAHKYGDWSVALEETCTSIGYSMRTCSLCGYKDYKFTRATGHSFLYTVTIEQSDCVLDGVKLLSCIECGTVKSEVIPAKGHRFIKGVCRDCGITEFSQGLEYALNSDGTYYIVTGMGTCTDNELRIPEEYNGLPVKEVKGGAFVGLDDIVSVNIPRTITFMGRFAFGGLKSLEKVYYNAANCVDLADWGADVFMNSGKEKGLTVTIGKDVEHVPANLFNFKSSSSINDCFVKKLTFEAGSVCRSIGRRAFWFANITELVLPDSIEIIGDGAFRGCEILKKVTLGNNVNEIGKQAFHYCNNLAEINIPDSITKLGSTFINYKSRVMKYNEYDDCLYLGNETNPYVVLM